MTTVNMHQAKTQFSKLLQQVEAGEKIVIAREGKPSAQLVPINAHNKGLKPPGAMRDQIRISDDNQKVTYRESGKTKRWDVN